MSSATNQAFLDDILAHPEDDTPRLIYADWLTDHGQQDRGEFIRVQIERARLAEDDPAQDELERREQLLLGKHDEWYDLLDGWMYSPGTFVRGFLGQVNTSVMEFLRLGEDLARRTPLRSLVLRASPRDLDALLESPALDRLRELTAGVVSGEADLATWAQLRRPLELERLDIQSAALGPDGLGNLLASSAVARLTELGLWGNILGADGVRLLAEAGDLRRRLRRLELGLNDLDDAAVEALTAEEWPALRALDLGQNGIGNAGLARLGTAGLPALAELKLDAINLSAGALATFLASSTGARRTSLSLAGVPQPTASIATLLASGLGRLRSLNLNLNRSGLGDADLCAPINWPGLAPVTQLNLSRNGVTVAGVRALIASPHLGRLRVLDLSVNPLGDAGVAALCDGPALPALRVLFLDGVEMTAAGARRLATWPGLASVARLSLAANDIGADGAVALAESPYLGKLGWLDLSDSDIGAGMTTLAAAPWLAGVWHLSLRLSDIDSTGAQAVIRSPTLGRPTLLNLMGNWELDAPTRSALRERFGRALYLGQTDLESHE
jgi:uncharacterized protein (TIGR02996 family)